MSIIHNLITKIIITCDFYKPLNYP